MARDYCVALPYDTAGLTAVCDCVFSLSYSLTILDIMWGTFVSPFPGVHKAARNRHHSIIKTNVKHKITKTIHKRSTALERSVLKSLGMLNGAKLMTVAAVRSKALVLLLLIHCLMFLPLVCRGSVLGPWFVMHYSKSFLILQSS